MLAFSLVPNCAEDGALAFSLVANCAEDGVANCAEDGALARVCVQVDQQQLL